MKTNRILNQLLATTMFCGAAISFASPAFAQDTPDPNEPSTGPVENATPDASADGDPDAADQGDILVTGSRIPQPNLTSTSPVTVLNSAEVKLQGTTRTEDIVNSLPQAFAGQGGNLANGATGTATVDLRNLGASRTLVLINGRRLQAGDPAQAVPVADINFIPAAIVRRVDVLTGGASSVYGADAVSGVVNFIMDTEFEGIRIDGQYSFYQHVNDTDVQITQEIARDNFATPGRNVADGGTIDLSMAIGAGFDDGRGHVMAYATYRKLNSVLQGNRDYSTCALTARTQAQVTADPNRLQDCGGSATSDIGTFFTNLAGGTFQTGPNRTFVPGFTAFNFAPYNYFQRPDERYTAGAFATYEINEAFKPFLEAMFMDDRTVAQIAPSGNFGNTQTINCDSPLMSAQQRAIACAPANLINANGTTGGVPAVFIDTVTGNPYFRGFLQPLRRNVEGGGRQADLQHTDYRLVAGMRGDFAKGLSYEAYYQYGRVVYAQTYLNDFSVTRLARSLDVIDNPATPGVDPTCRSVLDGSDPNCVPYDIFALNSINPAALTYLQTPGFARGNTQQSIAHADITLAGGEYGLQSPWASEGFGFNFGVEYRKESLELNTDTAFSTGDLAGQGGATLGVAGSFDVREAFVEGRFPIVSDRPFFHELSLGAGYRYSHYEVPATATTAANSFNTDTYKFEADWAPVRDVRFRASYNRAVRAPNVSELFVTQSVGLDGSTDPCAGAAVGGLVNGFTAAQCALTGVTAAQFGNIVPNPADQYNGLLGGNPALEPEIATTKTAGIVFQPRFLPRFAATIDYFDIKINNLIGIIGADLILDQCVTSGQFCNLIVRDAQGSLWRSNNGFVIDTNLNSGSLRTKGIDWGASYSHSLGGIGTVSFNTVGTWLDTLFVDPVGDPAYNCVGFHGVTCGTPTPEWRAKTRLTLTTPDGIGLSVAWRYFSSVQRDTLSPDPDLATTTTRPADRRIAAQNYIDLTMTAKIGDHYSFRLGVNNIFDREPPIATQLPAGFGSGNTYPQVYDAMGRYIFAGVTLDF
jgi:outer membrane receptor protein involved in Fe transport